MNNLTTLANQLNITVNQARKVINNYGYKSSDLTEDIVGYIVRTEKGETQQVFTGETEPIKDASGTPGGGGGGGGGGGVSYLELVQDEGQAMTLFSLAKSFGIDPNNIPSSEIEVLKSMLSEAEIVASANQFLEESEKALVASQFTDFKIKVESTVISSELAAEIAHKAGQSAYNRRLLELQQQDREKYQENQENLQSGLIGLLQKPSMDMNGYQQKAVEGHERFFGRMNRRSQMIQNVK